MAFSLGTFSAGGPNFAGLVKGDRILNLGTFAGALGLGSAAVTTLALLQEWERTVTVLADLAERELGDWRDLADLDVRAPIVPRQILQAGANYRTHVIELAVAHRRPDDPRSEDEVRAEAAAVMDRRAAHGVPYLFLGLPSSIAGPYDDVVLPDYSDQHDWELELAAVIGRAAFRVGADKALNHVAAYTIANDLTTRNLVLRADLPEIGTDWFRAKCAPGFLPLGPYLMPSCFVPDPTSLRLTLELNGQTMQDGSTKDMIFDVAALVSSASRITRLLPGDLVLTGSPAGNGAHWGRLLRPGDVMVGAITGLGQQRTRCVADSGAVGASVKSDRGHVTAREMEDLCQV
jgi:2-keto-4-pentenoate hydratase/2-oxohepta-3-ene-1,7-dioic acid hydratase in catechol pathway